MNAEKAKEDFQKAHLLIASGRNDKEALALLKGIVQSYQPQHVDAHIQAALIYMKYQKYSTAIDIIEHLHSFNPPTVDSLTIKARAQLGKKQIDCKVTLDRIFAIDRGNVDAVLMKGILLVQEKNYEEALRIFHSLSDRMPAKAELLFYMALAYYGNKEYNNCAFYLKKVMENSSASPQVKRLYEAATKKLVDDHVNSVLSDKNESLLNKLIMRFRRFCFSPGLVQAVQVKAVNEAREDIRDQQKTIEPLTGALNFYALNNYVPGFYILKKPGDNLYVVFVDVDNFGSVNNIYGHEVGNEILIFISKIGIAHFPGKFFRYGGDEFVWCFETDNEEALILKAEEFRKDVELNVNRLVNEEIRAKDVLHYPSTDDVESRRGELIQVKNPYTISQGAVIYGTDGSNLESVKAAADGCLYVAKDSGCNCVVVRTKVTSKGESPFGYSREIIKELDAVAAGKGYKVWWELEPKLSKQELSITLDNARIKAKEKE